MAIFQSGAWGDFQRKLGLKTFERAGDGWRYVAVVRGSRTWRYLHCAAGPVVSGFDAFDAALADLQRVARRERCWFVRVEPDARSFPGSLESIEAALRGRNLRRSPRDARPTHTRIIDLTQDEDAILMDMAATNRTLHRNIYKKGVTITPSTDPEDIEILLPMLDAVAERKHFNRRNDAFLREASRTLMPRGAATLYIARLHGTPIGATLVYDSDDTRTYAHPAMSYEHRMLNAGRPMVVRMILDAKVKGLIRFDFWGVAPHDAGPEHEWQGFTKFKRTFGGHTESAPGSWDLPVNRVLYTAFPVLRTAREHAIGVRWTLHRRYVRVRACLPLPQH